MSTLARSIKFAITLKLGKIIVKAYMLPVIAYSIPMWSYLAAMHKLKLQSIGLLYRRLKCSTDIQQKETC